ncbi:MAG: DUF2306 domain-containing protein [Bacteroidetes bacterium]|nr:MAG: DUF2306 domain-containing protein [Bacteroidota bacterium]
MILYRTGHYLDTNYQNGYLTLTKEDNVRFVRWTIIVHGFIASVLIILSTILIFGRIERKYERLHRTIGKVTVLMAIIILIPTGYILSIFNSSGNLASILFLILTSLTLISILNGWRSVLRKELYAHQLWMHRFYILLSSAIWLRINMSIAFYFYQPTSQLYAVCIVLSWLPQLIFFEILKKRILG